MGPEGQELGDLWGGRIFGDEDVAGNPSGRAKPRQGAGGIPGGSARKGLAPKFSGHGHRHRCPPVLAGGRGLEAIVLDPDPPQPQFLCRGRPGIKGCSPSPQPHRVFLPHRKKTPVPPKGETRRLWERARDLGVIVEDLQVPRGKPAARAEVVHRPGRKFPAAGHTPKALGLGHPSPPKGGEGFGGSPKGAGPSPRPPAGSAPRKTPA